MSNLPIFDTAASAILSEVTATVSQRGSEYADSWAVENMNTTFLSHTFRALGISERTREEMRLVLLAALVDVKDSRLAGPFKRDSIVDGVAYRACFGTLMQEYIDGQKRAEAENMKATSCNRGVYEPS